MSVSLAGDSRRLNDPSVTRNSASLSLPSAASGKVSLNDACLAENSELEIVVAWLEAVRT